MSNLINTDTMYVNFTIASKNWVNALTEQLSKIDKEKDPIAYEYIQTQLNNASNMHYELTGNKSKQFKQLLCTTI
jgi:hypothetical protein